MDIFLSKTRTFDECPCKVHYQWTMTAVGEMLEFAWYFIGLSKIRRAPFLWEESALAW